MEATHERAWRTLREVARREGVTLDEVVREIETAIAQAWSETLKSGDPETIARWNAIPRAGQLPTAVEMLEFLAALAAAETDGPA